MPKKAKTQQKPDAPTSVQSSNPSLEARKKQAEELMYLTHL